MALLSTRQAAAILGFNEQTLRLWRLQNRGPKAISVGSEGGSKYKKWRYHEDDLRSYIDKLRGIKPSQRSTSHVAVS